MTGPRLASAAPEPAPDAASATDAAYAEVRTITAAIVAALFFDGVMQTSIVGSAIVTQTIGLDLTLVSTKLNVKSGCFQSTFLRRRFPGYVLGALKL
jgi:hypothetical protein